MKYVKSFESFNYTTNEEIQFLKDLWSKIKEKFKSLVSYFTGDIKKGIELANNYYQQNPDKAEAIAKELKKSNNPSVLERIFKWFKNLTASTQKDLEKAISQSAYNKASLYMSESSKEDEISEEKIKKTTKLIFGEDFGFGALLLGAVMTILGFASFTMISAPLAAILTSVGIIIGVVGWAILYITDKEKGDGSDIDDWDY